MLRCETAGLASEKKARKRGFRGIIGRELSYGGFISQLHCSNASIAFLN
jgi:hypothetical protein